MLAFIIFTIAWTISAVVGNAFQCLPPRYFWTRTRSSMDGHCRSSDEQRAFSFTIGSLSLAEDLALLVVPMTMVWRLQLARAKKIRVVILFGLGGLYGCPPVRPYFCALHTIQRVCSGFTNGSHYRVCIISILRLIELIHFQTDNITGRILHARGLWQIQSFIITNLQDRQRCHAVYLGFSRDQPGDYMLLARSDEAIVPRMQGVLWEMHWSQQGVFRGSKCQ
jgi:hypothetical protein